MQHKLSVSDVTFAYGSQNILSHFSAEFTVGIPYAITGKSGSGKTTLLRLIAGLISPSGGEIIGGGIGRTAFAFQDHRLFPTLTALKNAAITADVERARTMLTEFGFNEEDMQKLPHALSGGMKQRVSLVRAFLSPLPILLLDEPSSSLDDETATVLHRYIREAAKTRIVILVSHDIQRLKALSAVQIPIA